MLGSCLICHFLFGNGVLYWQTTLGWLVKIRPYIEVLAALAPYDTAAVSFCQIPRVVLR